MRAPTLGEERRRDHQQHGRGDERLRSRLAHAGGGEADVASRALEHERELADLRERQGRGGRGRRVVAEGERRRRRW